LGFIQSINPQTFTEGTERILFDFSLVIEIYESINLSNPLNRSQLIPVPGALIARGFGSNRKAQ
jgi:hypothetical protein